MSLLLPLLHLLLFPLGCLLPLQPVRRTQKRASGDHVMPTSPCCCSSRSFSGSLLLSSDESSSSSSPELLSPPNNSAAWSSDDIANREQATCHGSKFISCMRMRTVGVTVYNYLRSTRKLIVQRPFSAASAGAGILLSSLLFLPCLFSPLLHAASRRSRARNMETWWLLMALCAVVSAQDE